MDNNSNLDQPAIHVRPDRRRILRWVEEYKRFKKSIQSLAGPKKRPLFPIPMPGAF
jgi:hypothetical protein